MDRRKFLKLTAKFITVSIGVKILGPFAPLAQSEPTSVPDTKREICTPDIVSKTIPTIADIKVDPERDARLSSGAEALREAWEAEVANSLFRHDYK